jgi:general secretion pathway protein B
MSYILDALRRADAERERGRGKVPGLYTEQLPGGAADWAPAPNRPPWLGITIGIGATVLLIGGVAAWMAFSREPAPMVVTVVNPAPSSLLPPDRPNAAVSPVVPAPVAPTPAAVLPPTAEPAAAPTKPATKAPPAAAAASGIVKPARPSAPPRPASAAQDAATAKARPAKTAPAEPPARSATASPATPPAAASAPASAAAAATAAKPPRVPTLAELPADIRQQLPTLAVGGAMYSPTPSNRMLILNGQLYHEGEQPAPGLTLESIQLRSAVLSFKGQRYEISY